MITYRAEGPDDAEQIRALHQKAFGGPTEGRLVDALRPGVVSQVALLENIVVGHILFSLIAIGEVPALALAPMGVLPHQQKSGIGTELVRRGFEECKKAGHRLVLVLGKPQYYSRFGFVPAASLGIEDPFSAGDAFQVRELVKGALAEVRGPAHYPAAFRSD